MGRRNGLALLAWVLVGAGLRFWQLDTKTPWSDEWATLVFSLGHSFKTIPLDQLLSLDELLAIARLDDASVSEGLGQVWRYLMTESTHPPLYFWLMHLWLRLWQVPGELVGLGVARSLSALLGVTGIPAAYGLGYWVMAGARSAQRHRVALAAAALMALSPFGVYLAQEARHYTLALLWVMASLGCFVVAWKALRGGGQRQDPPSPLGKGESSQKRPMAVQASPFPRGMEGDRLRLSWSITLLWVAVNGLGLATHYFVGLLLAAEGLALAGLIAMGWFAGKVAMQPVSGVKPLSLSRVASRQVRGAADFGDGVAVKLIIVGGGALLAAVPWLPFWLDIPGDRLTEWISQDVSLLERWVMPLLRLGAWLMSMVMLLPVEQVPVGLAVLSGLGLLMAGLWLLPHLGRSLRQQMAGAGPTPSLAVEALLAVEGAGLLLVLAAIYLWQKDLSLATRYFFVFLPGTVLLIAMAFARLKRREAIALLLLLGFVGSLAVTTGYAFQKPDRPDLLIQAIALDSQNDPRLQTDAAEIASPVISTFYKTHEQLSEMLAVAWELHRQGDDQTQFLIAERKSEIIQNTLTYLRAVASHERPFIVWEFNLTMAVDFPAFGCALNDDQPFGRVPGYRYRAHLCLDLETDGRSK